jgi:hypothetical protein
MSDAGEGAPDIFGGHNYFFGHKKPLASGGQEVWGRPCSSISLASLTGLVLKVRLGSFKGCFQYYNRKRAGEQEENT